MEQPYIAAYWKNRKESEDNVVNYIKIFLQFLADEYNLSEWYYKGRSKKLLSSKVEITNENIRRHLSRNKNDSDKSIIEQLGYSFSCWNGNTKNCYDFNSTIGIYDKYNSNVVLLYFPLIESITKTSNNIYNKILKKMIEIFDPEIAIIKSSDRKNENIYYQYQKKKKHQIWKVIGDLLKGKK